MGFWHIPQLTVLHVRMKSWINNKSYVIPRQTSAVDTGAGTRWRTRTVGGAATSATGRFVTDAVEMKAELVGTKIDGWSQNSLLGEPTSTSSSSPSSSSFNRKKNSPTNATIRVKV